MKKITYLEFQGNEKERFLKIIRKHTDALSAALEISEVLQFPEYLIIEDIINERFKKELGKNL